jgi:hypothetical protein
MEAEKIDYILLQDNDDKINLTAFLELSEKEKMKNNSDLLRYLTTEYYVIKLLFIIMLYNPFINLFIKLDIYLDIQLSRDDRNKLTKIHIAIILLTLILIQFFGDDTLLCNISKLISGLYLILNIVQLIKSNDKEKL